MISANCLLRRLNSSDSVDMCSITHLHPNILYLFFDFEKALTRVRTPLTHCSLFAKVEGVYEGMQIEWGMRAIRDMRRLAARDRERIIAKIEQYAENPASLARQVTTLTGGDYSRLRDGNHRVIFATEHGEPSTLIVLRVRHRREAYD